MITVESEQHEGPVQLRTETMRQMTSVSAYREVLRRQVKKLFQKKGKMHLDGRYRCYRRGEWRLRMWSASTHRYKRMEEALRIGCVFFDEYNTSIIRKWALAYKPKPKTKPKAKRKKR